MPNDASVNGKSLRATERFECIALLLQGGGALGSYQGGVYQALSEANLHPDWVAGISIGAVNSALIAGNPPEKRVEKLRDFWEAVSSPPLLAEAFASSCGADAAPGWVCGDVGSMETKRRCTSELSA
jgi:NTE family protein